MLYLGLCAFQPSRAEELLTPLAPRPHWAQLDAYQRTLTREDFVERIDHLYAPDKSFWSYAEMDAEGVTIFSDLAQTQRLWRLEFAVTREEARPRPHPDFPNWQRAVSQPLAGLTICLDPGHIGGDWARMEGRWMQLENDPPVIEAQLNLWACRQAEPLLQAAGARVVWTKRSEEPVTKWRPEDLRDEAIRAAFLLDGGSAAPLRKEFVEQRLRLRQEIIFYRNAEIRARAELVEKWQPDLTLCVHFNAAPWPGGEVRRKNLVEQSRLVVFVHGQYSADELRFEDEKFDLLQKCLAGMQAQELALAESMANQLQAVWKMPPEIYENWAAARRVGKSPYVFARNLLANRLFTGPVVFVEGPYMNARDAYARLIAGDYEGTREIAGRTERSIFREYGEILAHGVIDYFQSESLSSAALPTQK